MFRQAVIVALFVLALRLPFLNQPIQGDDVYYLAGAEHGQIEPLHPLRARYAFSGEVVSMQGHPHPPLNVWVLTGLLAALGDVHEVPFHAAYISFSLIAALSALSIARRFTAQPLLATLLFCAVPAFVVNGTSFESDLPLLSFWLLSVALFLAERWAWAGLALVLVGFSGYQSVVLIPILAARLWQQQERRRLPWLLLLVIPCALGAWQLWERSTSGALPAQVLVGYFDKYGLQRLAKKLTNAAALTVHAAWLVCPLAVFLAHRKHWLIALGPALAAAWFDPNPLCWGSVFIGVLLLASLPREGWLGHWALLFFAAALLLFFAGSARYLLPLALPVCILMAERTGYWAVAANLALGLALASVNYQQWDGYRQFAATLPQQGRIWDNGEWGFRFYLESQGALPLLRGQAVQPGQLVVSSQLAMPIPYTTGGGFAVTTRQQEIRATLPLRLIGLGSQSAYSSAEFGLRPFDLVNGPVDIVKVESVVARAAELSYLQMGSPEATSQIVSGVHQLEGNQWRWMDQRAVLLLKRPAAPAAIEVKIYLPPEAPGRTLTLSVDGAELLNQTLPATGAHTLRIPLVDAKSDQVRLTIAIDKGFQVPNDNRRLGLILASAGFVTSP